MQHTCQRRNLASMSATGKLIAVVGSRGGAGASCLAAALAKGIRAQTEKCVLVDLCAGSAGLEVLLGIEAEPGARWPEMEAARGEVDGAELIAALPQWQGVTVLSGNRTAPNLVPDEIVLDVCAGLLRNGGIVVLDLPNPTSWTPALKALAADADQVLIATPDSMVGIAGAVAVIGVLNGLTNSGMRRQQRLRVRDFAEVAEAELPRHRATTPGRERALALRTRRGSRVTSNDVAKLVGAPVAVQFRDDRNLATAIELGIGPISNAGKRLAKAGRLLASEVLQ